MKQNRLARRVLGPRGGARHGMMMIELLMMLIILSAFAIVTTRMFVTVMKLNREAAQVHTDTVRLDSAVRVMRGDVWEAGEVAEAGGEISVKNADAAVQWSVEKDGAMVRILTRDGKSDVKRWETGIAGMTLRAAGPVVVLSVPEGKKTRGGELWMSSQVGLAERMAS